MEHEEYLAGHLCLLHAFILIPCLCCCMRHTKAAEGAGSFKFGGFPPSTGFQIVWHQTNPTDSRSPPWHRGARQDTGNGQAVAHLLADVHKGFRASCRRALTRLFCFPPRSGQHSPQRTSQAAAVPCWKLHALCAVLCWRDFPCVDWDVHSSCLDLSPGGTSCPSKYLLADLAGV